MMGWGVERYDELSSAVSGLKHTHGPKQVNQFLACSISIRNVGICACVCMCTCVCTGGQIQGFGVISVYLIIA
jgi:hypothetical protein